jgi:hypothetical protein
MKFCGSCRIGKSSLDGLERMASNLLHGTLGKFNFGLDFTIAEETITFLENHEFLIINCES